MTDRPNPNQTWRELWGLRDKDLEEFGVAYVWVMRGVDGCPTMMFNLHADDVVCVQDPRTSTYGYLINCQGKQGRTFIDQSDVMVTRRTARGQEW